jgi:Holliday junction DNA helicase RuvB
LRKRIPTQIHLRPYCLAEMREIVALLATRQKVLLTAQATGLLAKVSHGLPRRAKHLLMQLKVYAPLKPAEVGLPAVREFLKAHRVDRWGLGPTERRYLRVLAKAGRASLETLAAYLGTDRDDVLRQIEPVLLSQHMIDIGPSGRKLTTRGMQRAERQNSARKTTDVHRPAVTAHDEEE